jgi:PAS domain S-box-containing protein
VTRLTPLAQPSTSRITPTASLLLIAIGVTVLAGWALDVPNLKGLWGQITVKPNTALGLLSSGLALALLGRPGALPSIAGRGFAVLAGAIGAMTLTQHLSGWHLGIDEFLFSEDPGAAATASPARMGPNSSLSLTLAGIAMLGLYRSTPRSVTCAQLLGACMALFALVPTVGYIYGATALYAVAKYTGIAFPTGLSLLILSAGIMAARSDAGPIAAITVDAPHGLMARRLLVACIAVPLLLGYLRLTGERRQLFDSGLGTSMFVVAMIVLLTLSIWQTAVALERSDEARRSAIMAASESEERFRSLADQAPVLIWVEEIGARLWFNRLWYEFTGANPGSLNWQELVHPDDLRVFKQVWQRASESGTAYSHQYRLRRADGAYAWVLETASPRSPVSGSAGGYVGSCVDITELRQAQQDRDELLMLERAAREKAERADRAKDEFIAALSHELRTPLNAILGWMYMLQQASTSPERRDKATEAVVRNAAVLSRLIEDLLDTSRITTGHLSLTLKVLELEPVVKAALESVQPMAAAKGVRVVLQAGGDLPQVEADAGRLQQIVWNLLSNAIKFSPIGGQVEVTLSSSADAVLVSVRDSGEGIDPAFLPHVFERFRQADSSTTRSQSGLGLGLYIAKHLTFLHGGNLTAQSDGAGLGAVFTVQLPRASVVQPAA